MLGDSVRRNVEGGRRGRRKASRAGRSRRWYRHKAWLWLAALVVPFGGGYLVATRILFPEPPVVAEGTPVPQLVGHTVPGAEQALATAGLGGVITTPLPNSTVPEGLITAQSPLAGQQLRPGSPVRVAVSSGVPSVTVPDVRGFASERATTLLRGMGFEVTDTVDESDLPAGRVTLVEPEPGSVLDLPAAVRIFVSTGPPPDTLRSDSLLAPLDTIDGGARGPLARYPERAYLRDVRREVGGKRE
ncbi:MAG: PASTA domain-containing protein [Gemmatimonadota bacterium]